MKLKTIKVDDIIPYEDNPRFNDAAVPAVMESIRQCGYVAPIIVDEKNVVLAGHTRLKAAIRLGYDEIECIVMSGLKSEQKRKFRILDNKIHELADWDVDLLKGELENLDIGDVNWFEDIINPNLKALTEDKSDFELEEDDDGKVVCPKCGAVIAGSDGSYVDEEDM